MKRQLVRPALKAAVAALPGSAREAIFDLVAGVSKAIIAILPRVAHEAVLDQICEEVGRNELERFQMLHIGKKTGQFGEHKRATIDVEGVRLDEIAGNLNEPLAVKIDTRGAEPFVVSGGKETLS